MATKNTAETETDTDGPLIDLNEADVKKLIARGKKRGYLTYDELNAALPQDEMSSEQIEDIMSAISDMGINIVESDEDVQEEADAEPDDEVDVSAGTGSVSNPAIEKKKETVDRTDDPVRMYLREMGAVELLSREGEIAIAKRIEAGRDTMILGLCESPLTFNAIIEWSNALNNGDMQLREIVDLEAMLSKDPVPENLDEEGADDNGEISEKTAGVSFKDEDEVEEEPAADSDDEDGENSSGKRETFEEDEEDNTLSLAAMEELLKPDALEKFANITKSFKAFSKLQDARSHSLNGNTFTTGTLAGKPVVLFLSGISMTNATMNTQLALDRFKVSHIVFSGIAGGVNPQLHVGDVTVPAQWGQYLEVLMARETAPGRYTAPPFIQDATLPAFGMMHPRPVETRSAAKPDNHRKF